MSTENKWAEAPEGATHYLHEAWFIHWYKNEGGNWFYHNYIENVWSESVETNQAFFDSMESRP